MHRVSIDDLGIKRKKNRDLYKFDLAANTFRRASYFLDVCHTGKYECNF